MIPIVEVDNLCKTYPGFRLSDVCFRMEPGQITGFIGRNGAGKTTTLKSMMNIVHPDSGEIRFFGLSIKENEGEIKRRIGYAGGAVDFYRRKKISTLLSVTSRFYDNWDEKVCEKYMDAFSLDANKTPAQLSEGMRVKLSLTMALSHHAELLILDEPTSGLDPVSREELLEVFLILREQGISILFSTHITSDLEKCADQIVYIAKGHIITAEPINEFLRRSREEGKGGTLEEIMVYTEKEDMHEKLAQ